MTRILTVPILLSCLLVAACDDDVPAVPTEAQQLATNVREGCVADTVALFAAFVDRVAPLALAPDEDHLLLLAEDLGCTVSPTGDPGVYAMHCRGVGAAAPDIILMAQFDFRTPGAVRVILEAGDAPVLAEGILYCGIDAGDGLAFNGTLSFWFPGSCSVLMEASLVSVQAVADLPGTPLGALYAGGSLGLSVLFDDGRYAEGGVVLEGRRALVSVEVDGEVSTGELALD